MTRLVIKRELNASLPKVFQAWSNTELLRKWILPSQSWTVAGKNDFVVGGEYFIEFTDTEGVIREHTGKYIEIIPNKKIVYTWNMLDTTDTIITVELQEVDGKTEVTLTHEPFPSAEIRDRYHDGWQNCLNHLDELLSI
ncbi:MAG: SRPBCC domain-containing protein [Proteobacteria bacterium]|nr:SRPBCC domain-containing protein [Pseudomonadota bacterium]